jgi:hypothetical protein
MSVVAKILVVVNLCLAVAFLAASATFLGARTHWKKLHEDDTAAWAVEKADLEGTVTLKTNQLSEETRLREKAIDEKKEAERLLKEKENIWSEIDKAHQALNAAHASLTSKLDTAETEMAAKDKRITDLLGERDSALSAKEEAVNRENVAVADKERLGDELLTQKQMRAEDAKKIAAQGKEIAELKLKLKGYEEQIGKLPEILVAPAIDGTVTGVSANYNLVMLSVGRDDHVKEGYEFTIYRNGEYVAKIVVDRVEKDHCTGYAKKGVQKAPIREGDRATTRF